jgi:REP element-mobilizing transposase RayT
MPHFYPKHLERFSYLGKLSYALAFSTENRRHAFNDPEAIGLVAEQLLRAGRERRFTVVVYCLMPDHGHLVVDGERDDSDCLAFIKTAKQYSGFYYKQRYQRQLWQRYGYEHFIRDYMERALTIRYVLANPVRAGLVADPRRFRGLGSQKYTIEELMQMSEYSSAYLLD